MKLLLPAEHLALESALPPRRVLDGIPAAVDECNRSTVLLGLRFEVDEDRVLVGWWPRLAFVQAGLAFVTTLLLAGALPLVELRGPDRWIAVWGALWLFVGGRLGLEVQFRAYRRRLVRVLRTAAGTTPRAGPVL